MSRSRGVETLQRESAGTVTNTVEPRSATLKKQTGVSSAYQSWTIQSVNSPNNTFNANKKEPSILLIQPRDTASQNECPRRRNKIVAAVGGTSGGVILIGLITGGAVGLVRYRQAVKAASPAAHKFKITDVPFVTGDLEESQCEKLDLYKKKFKHVGRRPKSDDKIDIIDKVKNDPELKLQKEQISKLGTFSYEAEMECYHFAGQRYENLEQVLTDVQDRHPDDYDFDFEMSKHTRLLVAIVSLTQGDRGVPLTPAQQERCAGEMTILLTLFCKRDPYRLSAKDAEIMIFLRGLLMPPNAEFKDSTDKRIKKGENIVFNVRDRLSFQPVVINMSKLRNAKDDSYYRKVIGVRVNEISFDGEDILTLAPQGHLPVHINIRKPYLQFFGDILGDGLVQRLGLLVAEVLETRFDSTRIELPNVDFSRPLPPEVKGYVEKLANDPTLGAGEQNPRLMVITMISVIHNLLDCYKRLTPISHHYSRGICNVLQRLIDHHDRGSVKFWEMQPVIVFALALIHSNDLGQLGNRDRFEWLFPQFKKAMNVGKRGEWDTFPYIRSRAAASVYLNLDEEEYSEGEDSLLDNARRHECISFANLMLAQAKGSVKTKVMSAVIDVLRLMENDES